MRLHLPTTITFWAITALVFGVIYFAGTATALILIWRAAQ